MTEKKRAIRPFDQTLRDINNGRLIDEIDEELTEVVEAIQRSGKAGSLTLTLKLKPRGECNEQLEVIPTIKGTKPERPRPFAIFFVNSDNGLQRDDPSQHQIPGLAPAEDKGAKTA